MSGVEEVAGLADVIAEMAAAEEAAAAGTAAEGAAGAGAAAEGGSGLAAADYAGLQGGSAAAGAGAGGLSAEDIAMAQAYDGGQGLLGNGMLSDPSSILAQDGSGNAFASDYDKYKFALQNGFRNLGKVGNSASGARMVTGLLGSGQRGAPPQTVVSPPHGGGTTPTPTAGVSAQQLHHVIPYAQVAMGGQDTEEMRRRLQLMLRGASN